MDRRMIVETGLRILDEHGLDGVTVRRLATTLGVKNPALYWHFRDKQELLDEMAEAVLSRASTGPLSDDQEWPAWIAGYAHERRRLLLTHRDGGRLVVGIRASSRQLVELDSCIAALGARDGFTPLTALRGLTTVGHFVTAFVVEEQADQRRHLDEGETPPEQSPARQAELLRSAPALAVAIRSGGDPGGDAAFSDGLELIISGIVAQVSRHLAAGDAAG